jgi:predicted MFS family arabinose efflux permease
VIRPRASANSIVLAAGFFILFVAGASRFALGLALRPMVDDLGWSRSALGEAVFLFQTVSAVCMFVAGRLADRISLRAVLGVGLCIGALGIGLMGLVRTPWQAIALYGVVFAIGNGITSTTPVGVMVTRAYAGRTGLANGFATSGLSVGQLVGIAVLSGVLATAGWRSVFFSVGAAALLAVAPIVLAIPRRQAEADRRRPSFGQGRSMAEAVRTGRFWLLIGVYAICGFNDFFVSTHIVAFAQDRGVDSLFAGELLALMGLTGLLGVVAAGAWGDRVGPTACTAWSFVVRAIIFGFIYFDQSKLAVASFALIFGATFLVTAPMTVLFVRESFGMRNLGALTGVVTMVHQVCGGLGAYVGARIFDATGRYDDAFLIMLASAALAVLLSAALGLGEKPASAKAGA